MYLAEGDDEFMRKHKVSEIRKKYEKKFGEGFDPFNYEDFPYGVEQYLDALNTALKQKKNKRT